MVKNVSLYTANINAINISTLGFGIWQHFSSNWTPPHQQKLANVPEVPVTQLYRNMIYASEPIHTFTINDDDEDTSLIWTILMHPGTCIGTISMIFVLCLGVYCFKLWIRPATSGHQPYSPVSSWHAIVDDVDIATNYRHEGKVEKLIRPCKNHDLQIEWETARLESHCKQSALAKGVLISGTLAPKAKILGMQYLKWLVIRLRFWPVHDRYFINEKQLSEKQWTGSSPFDPIAQVDHNIDNQLNH